MAGEDDWLSDVNRLGWVLNGLRERRTELRGAASRVRRRFPVGNLYHGPAECCAAAYTSAADIFEREIERLHALRDLAEGGRDG